MRTSDHAKLGRSFKKPAKPTAVAIRYWVRPFILNLTSSNYSSEVQDEMTPRRDLKELSYLMGKNALDGQKCETQETSSRDGLVFQG